VLEAPQAVPERKAEGAIRLVSLDAFRGLVMVSDAERGHAFACGRTGVPHSLFWRVIGFNTEHVEWQGCSLA